MFKQMLSALNVNLINFALRILFTFILGGFAAGLVIYWTTNNVLSMAQHYIIQRKIMKS